ncbi:MAG: hypothetical protein U9R75_06550, partial [Candidatus Thermoplasmatota archaeon]|nr:hypothetical protein [Candidatus Thermoplasmatota archaeon]
MRGIRLLMIALALLMTSLLPLAAGEEVVSEHPSRAPDKHGSITSDETWSGDLGVDNVIIEEGVTVTINKGTVINMYDEAEIWVRGTLLVQGGEATSDLVPFKLSFGSYWKGIIINDTGTADIQNATFSGGHDYIRVWGDDVRLKNILFDQGWSGVIISNGGGHDLDHLMGKYINSVVSVYSNTGPVDIHWVYGVEAAHYVVHLSNVHNITVDWIYAADSGTGLRIDGGCGGECGNITATRIMVNQTAPASPSSYGINLGGPIHGLYLEDITLSNLSFGIDINTYPGSKVTVRGLQTYGSINTLFNLDQDYQGIDMEVYDSFLEAVEIACLESDTADVN